MECDRRAAARLSRDQLAGKIDELIQAWYMQHALINRMLGEIRQLEVKLALGRAAGAIEAGTGAAACGDGAGSAMALQPALTATHTPRACAASAWAVVMAGPCTPPPAPAAPSALPGTIAGALGVTPTP
jgi:hypothetical protein